MKPTIYISSTIYDFADLRSSLKHVLEELGYSVLLSDYNDFRKPLDTNSYQSCLSALGQADYFVLLIGQRVGGLYDAAIRVSNMDLLMVFAIQDREEDVIRLSAGILGVLDGLPLNLKKVQLCPDSPIPEMNAELQKESISTEEALHWAMQYVRQAVLSPVALASPVN